jgi:hypothetical protein
MIAECSHDAVSDVVFDNYIPRQQKRDPFTALASELRVMLLDHLGLDDVANLRLASHCFKQLPQSYFRHLILRQMPWVWEVRDVQPRQIDWHALWCKFSNADGGACKDSEERALHQECMAAITDRTSEIVRGLGHQRWMDARRQAWEEIEIKFDTSIPFRARERPKETEVRGLRNRRRIYCDVEKILELIAGVRGRGSVYLH